MSIIFFIIGILLALISIGGFIGLVTEKIKGSFDVFISWVLFTFCAVVILTIAVTGQFIL